MARDMPRLRGGLRPPRNLFIFFALVVGLPAMTLIALGLRLVDQDRALARQRQIEMLDRAADQGVRALSQELATQQQRLEGPPCTPDHVPGGAACVIFYAGRMEVLPPQRIPYYPRTQRLEEFREPDSLEFREPSNFAKVLESSRALAASGSAPVRAGALVSESRILRRMGRIKEALAVYTELGGITSVSVNGEPADLFARRARCAILEEQSRTTELRHEAEQLAKDLRAGKWQLDRETYLHVVEKLKGWLDTHDLEPTPEQQTMAAAAAWLFEKWTAQSREEPRSSGVHLLDANGVQVTVLWSAGAGHDAALIAGPRFLESHWIAALNKAVHPARAYLAGVGAAVPEDAPTVQRTAAATGLPWTFLVTSGAAPQEPPEFVERRRNLTVGLAALLLLIAAVSAFMWRAVNRDMAVARLQSDFVSAVSHEFRTPLTTLRQFNELLSEEDGPTPEKRRRFYHAQTRATERLHRLVESVLDFGRMEEGRHPYNFKAMDAGGFARDVTEEFRSEVDPLGFAVKCNADSGPYPVSADPEALARALWNLLDNAVKYSGASRDVEVCVGRSNGHISIAVSDRGIGVPAAEQKTIFQKFVRGASSTSGGIPGTGLGLAMVQHIVEAHGGTIDLRSAEGQGSTFTITLPGKG